MCRRRVGGRPKGVGAPAYPPGTSAEDDDPASLVARIFRG